MKKCLFALCVGMACALAGCKTVEKMTPAYKHAQERTRTLERLQLATMRFSDAYCTRVVEAATRFQATAQTPDQRLLAQNWKVIQCQGVYIDAAGPNPALNVLDVIVLSTLSRMVVDDTWATYGERVELLQKTHHELEQGAWELGKPMLSDEQQAELRNLIARWRAQNPTVSAVGAVHFIDFAKSMGELGPGKTQKSGSIFSVVNLDPFAELDPAVQEITQSRQLAERSIFYFQRMPNIVSFQAERFPYEMAIQPETKDMLASAQRVSLVGSAADALATNLPSILDRQREALFAQLTSQSAQIGELSGNLRSTLEAGTTAANAINTMIESVNTLTGQFTSKRRQDEKRAARPPFDIRDYTEALRAATNTAQQLSILTQQLNTAAPVIRSTAQDLIDHIVRQVLLLVVVFILATLSAALAYRAIVVRMQRHVS